MRNAVRDLGRKTHPAELGAAVTTFWRSRELFDVVVAQDAARGLDNTPSRRRGVIRLALAKSNTLGHCCRWWSVLVDFRRLCGRWLRTI